jgi:Protein of unknown function (DUF2958)
MRETNRDLRGHDFLPGGQALAAIPKLYGQDGTPAHRQIVHLHYFLAGNDWWVTELDPDTGEAFGYARLAICPDQAEWGYSDLTELEQLRAHDVFVVERDLHWRPQPAGTCIPDLAHDRDRP